MVRCEEDQPLTQGAQLRQEMTMGCKVSRQTPQKGSGSKGAAIKPDDLTSSLNT